MDGIKYVVDETGNRVAVQIAMEQLEAHPELWEDFCDALLAAEREGEPRIPQEEVRKKLKQAGKLK